MICASIRSPRSSPWSRSHGARFKSTPPGTALPKRDTLRDLQSTARDDGSSATLTGLHPFPPTSPGQLIGSVTRGQLSLTGVSNNVGGVKHFSSVVVRALRRARHFALVEKVPIQPRLARNQYSGLELSPTHASLRSQLSSLLLLQTPPVKGAGYPINYSVLD